MIKKQIYYLLTVYLVFATGVSVVVGKPLQDGEISKKNDEGSLYGYGIEANRCSNRNSSPEAANMAYGEIEEEWSVIQDQRYGIEFQVPKDCQIIITIDQPQPYSEPQAIIRRYTAWCSQGLLDFDIWNSQGMNLDEWLIWYGITRQPLGDAVSRSSIGEIEVVQLKESTLQTTFWAGEKYIFRLWHTYQGNIFDEEFYKTVLKSFHFMKDDPIKREDVSRSLQGMSPESFSTVNPLVTTCCGYSSSGNPFECCDNKGNCVWWVYYRYGSVPFRGHAWTWWGQVLDYTDWSRAYQPRRDWRNIVWWNKTSYPPYGHVAFAATYTGGSTITISEMLYCNNCGRTRTINVSSANGYIFEAKHVPTGVNGGK